MNYNLENMDMLQQGQNVDNHLPKEILQYAVGALLYTPAFHPKIVETIRNHTYPHLKTWAFCLEDSMADEAVEAASDSLVASLYQLAELVSSGQCAKESLPLIFIRVRHADQITELFAKLKDIDWLLTGFIAPKFECSNMMGYLTAIEQINETSGHVIYLMPILESQRVIFLESRHDELLGIRKALQASAKYILNVRVGGNDFCNQFGLRRSLTESIYDMGLIKDILVDILNVFGRDFVVSAPVWEYFGNEDDHAWQVGLEKELRQDRLNGFVGKTAVHPSQLLSIQQSLMIDEADYQDALQIMNWQDERFGVSKGVQIQRMNEVRVHQQWAKKTLALASIYGVKRNGRHDE